MSKQIVLWRDGDIWVISERDGVRSTMLRRYIKPAGAAALEDARELAYKRRAVFVNEVPS